jgi:hypothetical protein
LRSAATLEGENRSKESNGRKAGRIPGLGLNPAQSAASNAVRPTQRALILDLIRRPEGATIEDIVTATECQRHGLRGFVSGTLVKKMGLPETAAGARTDAGFTAS